MLEKIQHLSSKLYSNLIGKLNRSANITKRAEKRIESYYCKALQGKSGYNICINSDLTVSCNCQDYDGSGKIGDLKHQTFHDIFFGEIANRFRSNLFDGILPTSVCERCRELHQLKEKNNTLIGEITIPKKGIMVENTVNCNFRCLACPRETLLKNRTQKNMSLSDFEKVSKIISEYQISTVHFFNLGEPFLSKNVLDEVKILKKYNPKLKIFTSTNGLLLDKKAKIDAALMMDHIYISIDGSCQSSVEKYQIGGNFNKSYSNLKNLVKIRNESGQNTPLIEWKYVVFSWNDSKEVIKKAIQLAASAGVDTISFWQGGGEPSFISKNFINDSFFKQLGVASWKGREIKFYSISNSDTLYLLKKLGPIKFQKNFDLVKEGKRNFVQLSVELLEKKNDCSDKYFIERSYQVFLGRGAEKEALDSLSGALERGEFSRGYIINTILNSDEFKERHRLDEKEKYQ